MIGSDILNGKIPEAKEYLQDESRCIGKADYIVFPETEEEVVEVVKTAYKNEDTITVSGARTGITGGAVPNGGYVVSLEKFNKIINLRKDRSLGEVLVTVEPGMTLKDIESVVEENEFFYPVNPTENTAQIGGTVATDASGSRSLKYGSTRQYIKRLKVVTPTGKVLNIPRGYYFQDINGYFNIGGLKIKAPSYSTPDIKNVAGYYSKPGMDIIDLFIGAEGTLGIITEIELAAIVKPEMVIIGLAFFPDEKSSLDFVCEVQKRLNPRVLEYFDFRALNLIKEHEEMTSSLQLPPLPGGSKAAVLFEHECSADIEKMSERWGQLLEKYNSSLENTWAGIDKEERIDKVRYALPEAINSIIRSKPEKIYKLGTDMAVPNGYLYEIMNFYRNKIEREKLDYVIFGHIGDNHLHVNVIPENESEMEKTKLIFIEFAKKVVEIGGTVSAEHGIGKLKIDMFEIMFNQDAKKQMKDIRRVLSPKLNMNPGTLFI